MFNQTRTAALGPYFNLTDACMLVAFVGFLFDKFHKGEPILLPQIVVLMLLVVTIAAIQSFWAPGWTHESMRAFRWALQTPIAIFLGANMVTTRDRAKKLVSVLLVGALLAAVQHVFFVANIWRARSLNMRSYQGMRTIGFWAGCMPSAFLVSAVLWKGPRNMIGRALYLVAGLLLLASLFLNQTRSLWIATGAAIICMMPLFKRRDWAKRLITLVTCCLLLFLALGLLSQYLLPGLDVVSVIANRADELLYNKVHTATRARSLVVEVREWFDGTLIFGRGLRFFDTIENSDDWSRRIAFGHLGYVTYLSQLGIVGLVVYGFAVPLWVLRNSMWLWRRVEWPCVRYLSLLSAASIICLTIMFTASSHFLALGYEPAGILYGATWALVAKVRQQALATTGAHTATLDTPTSGWQAS